MFRVADRGSVEYSWKRDIESGGLREDVRE
jgi:hypothetical protein